MWAGSDTITACMVGHSETIHKWAFEIVGRICTVKRATGLGQTSVY